MSYNDNGNRNIPWIFIVLGFMFFPPAGVVMLLLNIFGGINRRSGETYTRPKASTASQPGGKPYVYTPPQNAQNFGSTSNSDGQQDATQGQTPPQTPPQMPHNQWSGGRYSYNYNGNPKKAAKNSLISKNAKRFSPSAGKFWYGLGIFGTICGAFASMVTLLGVYFDGNLGLFHAVGYAGIVAACSMVPCALVGFFGKRSRDKAYRFRRYINMIGENRQIDIEYVASAIPTSFAQACRDIQFLIDEGCFPGAYIDYANHMFTYVLPYQAMAGTAAEAPKPKEEPAPEAPVAPKDGPFPEELEIRRINDAIINEYVSSRLTQLEALTHKILDYGRDHPEKADRLRQFKSHYLPRTIKILDSYARFERQGVNGENIKGAMKDVEQIMDKLVLGFGKQLDVLFTDEALDITTDVTVLENMMSFEGLGESAFDMHNIGDDFSQLK